MCLDNRIYFLLFNIFSITSFSQKGSKNCVFFQLDSMVLQNCELRDESRDENDCVQPIFIYRQSRGAGTVDTSASRSTRVWPVGGWNFDLANYDAFISTDSRASDGFTIDIGPGNVRSSENCSPLCENA